MPVKRTISMHIEGTKANGRGHNMRAYRQGQTPAHIDQERTKDNIVLVDEPKLGQVYERLFGESVREYNDRQKRADRQIKSYLAQVRHDSKLQVCYEAIVQVGNMADELTGQEVAVLEQYARDFQARNGSRMEVIGAVIHLDEATPHLHLVWVPYTEEAKRGPTTQVSMTGACRELGFDGDGFRDNPVTRWTASEREHLEALARSKGFEVVHVQEDRQHEANKATFVAERQAAQAQEALSALEARRQELSLEEYQRACRLKGHGMTEMPSKEADELRELASRTQEAEGRAEEAEARLQGVYDFVEGDSQLVEAWNEAIDRREARDRATIADIQAQVDQATEPERDDLEL